MQKKHILSIGRDSSVAVPDSQLRVRFEEYVKHHQHTLLILNTGESQEFMVGDSRVVLPGGRTLIGAFFRALFVAHKEAKTGRYDLVTTQDVLYAGLIGYLIAHWYRLPLFVQVHGDHLDNERWFKSKVGKFNRLMNVVGKFILRRANHIRVVSSRLKEQLVQNYRLEANRIISIPIGTDTSMFTPPTVEQREPIIAFAQRLILEKQPMLFVSVTVAVMRRLLDVKVVIAGDGFMKEEMVAAYRAAGLLDRVTFLGAVRQPELVVLYQKAKCYLHTADWEGWGMPMIEAMAAGCPVVTTDTGCAGEAIKDGMTGFVTKVNDEAALIIAVEKLLTDDNIWQKMSKQGIIEASSWSFASLTRRNMEWYATAEQH
jgi:glycosyltransferase involved in cell wall biosynthesis